MAKKEKQNVFDNDVVETLAFQYRKDGDFTSYRKICEESSNLMDAIIRTNKFDRQVPFGDIKNSLYLQIENWIRKWKPEDGKIYTYFSACSCGHHRLMTDQGVKTIQEIVENKLDVSVLSYDTDKKAFCYNKVTDWSKIPSSRDEWRRVSIKRPDGKRRRLLFTGNHEFYTGDNVWVSLDDSEDTTSHRMYHKVLTDYGKQAIMGSYLGDGSISGSSYVFNCTHTSPQKSYVEHKAKKLGSSITESTAADSVYGTNPEFKFGKALRPIFEGIEEMVIPGKKYVPEKFLESMNEVALAYWFMDDGCRTTGDRTTLHTESFSEEDVDRLVEWFASKWGVTWKKTRRKQGYHYLCLASESKDRWFEIIAPYIVPSMEYKLPERYRGQYVESSWMKEVLSVCDTEIRSLAQEPQLNIQLQEYISGHDGDWKQVHYTPDLNWKYDITVENTHCYFAEGVLVHNCIRNGCLSIVGKESLFNQRFAVTDVPLETIMEGYDAPSSDISDVLVETLQKVASEIYCRWEEPVIQEVLRYMVSCVLKGRGDRRQAIIETSILGWDINQDTARFLLDWSHGAVRASLLDHYNQPLGTVDVVRAAQKFSLIPDVINAVGLDNTVKLMNVFAGISIRFPSVQQVRKWQEAVSIYTSLSEDSSQENVKRLGKKYRKSPAKIQEAFENIVTNIKAGVLEDVELYPTVESLPKMT